MLIAAWHNSVVKRLDFTTDLVQNIAGTGARAFGGDEGPATQAKLDLPSSVMQDTHGNIFISDQANFRIRMIDPSGIIHTVCGTGTAGYTGDGGPALPAQLSSPKGQSAAPASRLVLDAQNRIYIADTGNHCIRVIDTDGSIRTIAGNGTAGYSGDGGAGHPCTAEHAQRCRRHPGRHPLHRRHDEQRRPQGDTGRHHLHLRRQWPRRVQRRRRNRRRSAQMDRPYGLDVGPDGTVYIADTHNHRIRRVTATLPPDYDPNGGGDNTQVTIIPCTDRGG